MFLLMKMLVCFGWIGMLSLVTLCALMFAKRVAEKAMFAAYHNHHNVRVEIKKMPNIVTIEKENVAIDAICNFCNVENGYCDNRMSDRMMLQNLYDEFLAISKERNDGNCAFARDLQNYRLDDPEARSKLLENLMRYLTLRRETNGNLLQYRKTQAYYK